MECLEKGCKSCGGDLIQQDEKIWACEWCDSLYDDQTAREQAKSLQEMFDAEKREQIANCRRNLYRAVTARHVSSVEVGRWCRELKKYIPDDFSANFYENAISMNPTAMTQYIREINADKNYDEMSVVIPYLIRSLQSEFSLELNNLIDRTYKGRNLPLYNKYATMLSEEAEKVDSGVYETMLPRDVFVAYSSKDMVHVSKLVDHLEGEGLKCFVAARNLRHGQGAVENYDRALKEAMDNCKTFVFVSSSNSRSLSCDALRVEIPYIKSKDIENTPYEFRKNYASIPHAYKKGRVEYRVERDGKRMAADDITDEFFDGYERVYSPAEVAKRVVQQLIETPMSEEPPKEAPRAQTPPKAAQSYAQPQGQAHVHKYESSIVAPTCTENGYTLHKCACGDSYKDNFTTSEHSFGAWRISKRTTCEDNGEEIHECSICGVRERRVVKATGHFFGEWQKYFIDGECAGRHRICKNCGYEDLRLGTDKSDPMKIGGNLGGQSKSIILLLCFFMGSLGVHNFVMGETKKGIVKIVTMFFCYIGLILAIIDFVKILRNTYQWNPDAYF